MDFRTAAAAVLVLLSIAPSCAQKNYGPGASDSEGVDLRESLAAAGYVTGIS